MTTEIELCGGFRLLREGRSQPVSYRRAKALLAYLAMEPGQHPRERLTDLLWPHEEPRAARESLRRMLSLLRNALGPAHSALVAERASIAFVALSSCVVDVSALLSPPMRCRLPCDPGYRAQCIAQAERAVAAYRGPLLDGLELPDVPDFDEWLRVRRADLLRRVLAQLERLSHCLERFGDRVGALRHARRHVELDPLDEAGYRRVMALLAADGQSAAALAEYAACERHLSDELGVAPCKTTRMLADRIEAGGATPDMPARAVAEEVSRDRRPIAVVCLRTAIGAAVDGEDAADAVLDQVAAALRVIGLGGGYPGPAVAGAQLAYFGFPLAREDAARAAVACALAATSEGMAAGVEAGLTVCDHEVGQPDVVGELTRAAMILADAAAAGETRIGATAAQAVAGWYRVCEKMGALRVLGPSGAESRLEARPGRTPLLGRASELDRLRDFWASVVAGEGRALLVRGEAGIGKSRLIAQLTDETDRYWLLRCRTTWEHTPFQPLIHLFGEVFGLRASEDEATRKRKLKLRLPLAAHDARTRRLFELLADVPGIPAPPSPQARQSLIDALTSGIAALAASGPVLLWVEDVHWADPSTLEVIERIVRRPPVGVFLLLAARPEFRPDWPLDSLDLVGLAEPTVGHLVTLLSAGRLSAEEAAVIGERADGVPLYIEELVSARLAGDGPIPATLAELLAAHVDAVPEARAALWLAAAVGRRFALPLLVAAGLDADSAARQVEILCAARLLETEGTDAFVFRHALVQEAAYRAMTPTMRRKNHAAVAAALCATEPGVAEREPALLAWHYACTGRHDLALRFAVAAGRQAAARSAHRDALHHCESALRHLAELPDAAARDAAELEIRLLQGLPLAALHGYGAPAVRAAYDRALALSGPAAEAPEAFPLIWGLWLGSSSWADYEVSLALARKLARLAEGRADDPYAAGHACYALGNSLFCRGEFAAAAEALTRGASLGSHGAPLSPYGEDARVTNLAFLSWAHWFLGADAAALAASRRSLARARRIDHPHSLAYALIFAANLRRWRGDIASARAYAEESARLAETYDFALWAAAAGALAGWARAAAGDSSGLDAIAASIERIRDVMGGIETMLLAIMLDACERSGAWTLALETAQRGLAVSVAKGDLHYRAEFLRVEGLALRALGRAPEKVAEALAQACATARALGSPVLLLRAEAALSGM